MEQNAKTVQKQVIVRLYQPDMDALKGAARQAGLQRDVQLKLYGQAGEVLVVIRAQAYAQAAATELTEMAAEQIEQAVGASAYARGKGSLAYVTAGEMIENECVIAAANPETGALIGEEFAATKRGAKVFDFGESSYNNTRTLHKIEDYAGDPDEETPLQMACDLATAAAKYGKAEFGCAVTGLESEKAVWAAVYYKGRVWARKIRPGEEAGKTAALTILDTVRLILQKQPVPYAKQFRAGKDAVWSEGKRAEKSGGGAGKAVLTALIVIILAAAIGVGVWYALTTFVFTHDEPESSSVSTSQVQSLPESQSTAAASDTGIPQGDLPEGNENGEHRLG